MTAPNFPFVFLDLTTAKTPDALRPTPSFVQALVAALQEQSIDFGQVYGMPSIALRVGSTSDRDASEIAINFRDDLPDAPGALADHSDASGVPDIEVGCDLFESLNDAGDSIASGVSHEILETLHDAGANGWAEKQDGSGLMGALETADPVQNTYYKTSGGVYVSNFVLPNYFIPGASGPWDKLGVMQSVTDFSHGYEIQAGAPTSTSQAGGMRGLAIHHGKPVFIVGAELTPKQLKRKSGQHSRTSRRGVRLHA